jgi:glycosyltransferase involved in cell wall biosynthesis
VAIAARIPGIERSHSDYVLLFDADCRIPNPGSLIDWYISQFEKGADLAYTHVDYIDLPAGVSTMARMFIHHSSRWFRRSVLGIPTTRGSNYAIKRKLMLDLFSQGRLLYDIHVGPVIRYYGGRIAYSGSKDLIVYTSGRFFSGGWKELFSYLKWRVGYYRRVRMLKSKDNSLL